MKFELYCRRLCDHARYHKLYEPKLQRIACHKNCNLEEFCEWLSFYPFHKVNLDEMIYISPMYVFFDRLGKDSYGRTVWTTPKAAAQSHLQLDNILRPNKTSNSDKDPKVEPKWNTRSSERKKSTEERSSTIIEDTIKIVESPFKQPFLEPERKEIKKHTVILPSKYTSHRNYLLIIYFHQRKAG
jgi:hypothetical protein